MGIKRHLIFVFLVGIFNASPLSAQEDARYIRDVLYIALREEPDESSEIVLAGLTSGTPLTLIAESDDGSYSRVETRDGERGWLQTQYLVDQPVARDLLDQAQQRVVSLEKERTQLAANLSALQDSFNEANTSLAELSQINSEQQLELEKLRNLSGNAIQLDSENNRLETERQQLENQLTAVTGENAQLKASMENNEFLNGALAVLLGVIITLIVPRLWPSKKSEWA